MCLAVSAGLAVCGRSVRGGRGRRRSGPGRVRPGRLRPGRSGCRRRCAGRTRRDDARYCTRGRSPGSAPGRPRRTRQCPAVPGPPPVHDVTGIQALPAQDRALLTRPRRIVRCQDPQLVLRGERPPVGPFGQLRVRALLPLAGHTSSIAGHQRTVSRSRSRSRSPRKASPTPPSKASPRASQSRARSTPRGGQWLLRGGCLTTAWQRGRRR